jgi:hypothetical protein
VRIYIASSPYHLLLVTALQVGNGDAPAIVVYYDDSGFLGHVGSIDDALPNVSFEEIRSGQNYPSTLEKWRPIVETRKGADLIRRHIRALDGNVELYPCNGARRDILLTSYRVKGSIPIHFVEDGLDAYFWHSTKPYSRRSLIHHYAWRLVNGHPMPDVFDTTTTLTYEKFHLLIPELRRSTIPLEKVEQIESPWVKEAADRLSKCVEPYVPSMSATDVLFASFSLNIDDIPSFVASVERWVNAVKSESIHRKCAVKLHPRESNSELIFGLKSLDLVLYPAWIPAELLIKYLDPNCRMTMGLSTFILSSNILSPGRRVRLDSSVPTAYADKLMEWDDAITTME